MSFEGEHAVVTGAAQGIGKEIVTQFVREGAGVTLIDVDQNLLHQTAEELKSLFPGAKIAGVPADITRESEVGAAFEKAERELGPVSILVNNAGVIKFLSLEDTSIDDWDFMNAVNLRGAFLCVKAVMAGMKQRRHGKIVSIGSSAGINGGARNVGAYAATKAGIMCLTKSLANEMAPFSVNVNGVAPALIDTRMFAGISDLAGRIPIGRAGTPSDVANAVLFLCREQSSFITGEIINVNGGFLID